MKPNSNRPRKRNHKSDGKKPPFLRTAQFDTLEPRKLLTIVQTLEPVELSGADPQLVVITTDASFNVTAESDNTQSPPAASSDFDSDEGLGWSEGVGFVPGSVLASADQIDWSTTADDETWDDEGSGSGSSFCSGSGGSSGSGSGGSSGSGSGGSSGSGSGGSSGSGSGGSSGSGSGGSSGSGSGGSSGSGSGGSSGSGSGGSSGSGSGGSSGSGSGGSSGSGSGGPTNTPPEIHDFAWSYGEGYYTFTGYVTDNVDPAGLTIFFGGLLYGQQAIIDGNGAFSFQVTMSDPSGQVTSSIQDGEGLWSETAYVEM